MKRMFDPVGFIDFAKLIESGQPDSNEGTIRSGISRAYYYAYLCTREEAKVKGYFPQDQEKIWHTDLINKMKKCKPISHQTLAHKLLSLKGNREKADYNLTVTISLSELNGAIQLAEDIVKQLPGLQHQ